MAIWVALQYILVKSMRLKAYFVVLVDTNSIVVLSIARSFFKPTNTSRVLYYCQPRNLG